MIILIYSICTILVFLIGYAIGRRVGNREGMEKGLAASPIILRIQMFAKGKCPICDKDN